ncbi:MAG: NAD(P)/FAD-dependent oxidoreductase [Kiloniellales bacterium]
MDSSHQPIGERAVPGETQHLDVIIVGAGISGIDAAYHLQRECPDKSLALLERKASFGGTWRLHRYPGIRSDSDLYTFGFGWKPWTGVPLATAEEILTYLGEALEEQDLARHVRYGQSVQAADWDSDGQRWILTCQDHATDEIWQITCGFLWMCQGYYRHEEGYLPEFPGIETFEGEVAHPQTWPEDLDYKGKRVVVIGSGATAATLIPAIAEDCAAVTMLQRSPTFFAARPKVPELAKLLKPLKLPDEWFHEIMRRSSLHERSTFTRLALNNPEPVREALLAEVQAHLGEDYDIAPHFTPEYRPWQQRIAVVPDGDLFKGIREGKVEVVTDHIERITATGIALRSGRELEADIIVTATGLTLSVMGDIPFSKDGDPIDFSSCWAHRGILFTGVPNMAWVFGYLRNSWTLRADLVSAFVCRLLKHMDDKGCRTVTPALRSDEQQMQPRLLVEPENFSAGYIQRSIAQFPKQGDREPWIFSQEYDLEKKEIPAADLEDGTLVYS